MNIDKEKFEKILKMDQIELKKYMKDILKESGYNDIVNEDGFLYARGSVPFLLVAHLDRHPNLHPKALDIDKEILPNGKEKWSSKDGIAGDDRCGVYLVSVLIKKYHVSVLFCEDEEIGCIGSKKFVESKYCDELKNLNYFIQIDRGQAHRNILGKHNKHGRDVVFYKVTNEDFIKKICEVTGFGIGAGTGTDIAYLTEATGIASFNISSGYYNEHSLSEYIVLEEMMNNYDAVCRVLDNIKDKYMA